MFLQKIAQKQRASDNLEEENHDNLDIKLLRFSAVFTYLYLSLILVTGIYHFHYLDDKRDPNSFLSILVGVLGLSEVASLVMFLTKLERKV